MNISFFDVTRDFREFITLCEASYEIVRNPPRKVPAVDRTGSVLSESVLSNVYVHNMSESHADRRYEQNHYNGTISFASIEIKKEKAFLSGKWSNFSSAKMSGFNPSAFNMFEHNGVKCDSLFKAFILDGLISKGDIERVWTGELSKFDNIVFRKYLKPEWISSSQNMYESMKKCIRSMLSYDSSECHKLAIRLLNTDGELVYRPAFSKNRRSFFNEVLGRLPIATEEGQKEFGKNILGLALSSVRDEIKKSGLYDSFKDEYGYYRTISEMSESLYENTKDDGYDREEEELSIKRAMREAEDYKQNYLTLVEEFN